MAQWLAGGDPGSIPTRTEFPTGIKFCVISY